MRFDTPATTNPIDQLKIVGKPVDRIDGPLKTTGTAPYAYERHDVVPDPAYGYVVGSAIAKGRIAFVDLTEAEAASAVLAVVTAENAGKLGKGDLNTARLVGGPDVQHYHQAIALVVAETFEQARAAAQLIHVNYVRTKGEFDLSTAKSTAVRPDHVVGGNGVPDTATGDFAGAFAAAQVQLDATYTTPDQAHAMMEPHASTAAWDGDRSARAIAGFRSRRPLARAVLSLRTRLNMATSTKNISCQLSARISWKLPLTLQRARPAFGACSLFAPAAGYSIQRRRAAK